MEREVVTGPDLPPQIGPYSQAVRAGGFVFVSGQPGIDPRTGEVVAGSSFGDEARQAFANLDAVLRAGDSRPDLVVNTTVLVADIGSFPELNELYAEFFASEPPARMVMQVPLPRGLRISIGCTAVSEA
jgi:2-iminobutanoate/2-iminopropanoate deaminase